VLKFRSYFDPIATRDLKEVITVVTASQRGLQGDAGTLVDWHTFYAISDLSIRLESSLPGGRS
jgi:hypothetical protein